MYPNPALDPTPVQPLYESEPVPAVQMDPLLMMNQQYPSQSIEQNYYRQSPYPNANTVYAMPNEETQAFADPRDDTIAINEDIQMAPPLPERRNPQEWVDETVEAEAIVVQKPFGARAMPEAFTLYRPQETLPEIMPTDVLSLDEMNILEEKMPIANRTPVVVVGEMQMINPLTTENTAVDIYPEDPVLNEMEIGSHVAKPMGGRTMPESFTLYRPTQEQTRIETEEEEFILSQEEIKQMQTKKELTEKWVKSTAAEYTSRVGGPRAMPNDD
jgi:hypothetical protein